MPAGLTRGFTRRRPTTIVSRGGPSAVGMCESQGPPLAGARHSGRSGPRARSARRVFPLGRRATNEAGSDVLVPRTQATTHAPAWTATPLYGGGGVSAVHQRRDTNRPVAVPGPLRAVGYLRVS